MGLSSWTKLKVPLTTRVGRVNNRILWPDPVAETCHAVLARSVPLYDVRSSSRASHQPFLLLFVEYGDRIQALGNPLTEADRTIVLLYSACLTYCLFVPDSSFMDFRPSTLWCAEIRPIHHVAGP